MVTRMMKGVQGRPAAPGAAALMLCLALSGGCASGSSYSSPSTSSSGMTSEELYNEYDVDNDNNVSREEWDHGYQAMDVNGDGVVTRDEFSARMGGGGRR